MTRRIMIALLLFGAATRADATDYTDIWWNPAESGWGVNFAQNDRFIFATFFVYGPGNAPTWYTGQLSLDAGGSFTGPLYATTGTHFATSPYNPAQTTAAQAGAATFRPTAADTGVLTYNVGNVQVAKDIRRQTLTPIALAGAYTGALVVDTSGCANPADNGPVSVPADVTVTQASTGQIDIQLGLLFGIVSCAFSSVGAVTQNGPLFSFSATYGCGNLPRTTATVSELRATSLGIEGRWTAPSVDGCREDGRFGAVKE